MKSANLLSLDHKVILRALELLRVVAQRIARDDATALGDARTLVSFFSEFADLYHHTKEESFLFPRLIQAGMPADAGPLGVMLFEHDQGRMLVANMRETLERGDGRAFEFHADRYSDLLANHIDKEDNVLFVIAGSALTEDDDRKLVDDFEAVDSKTGSEVRERFRSLLDTLESKYRPAL